MRRAVTNLGASLAVMASLSAGAQPSHGAACDALKSLTLPHATVTHAGAVAAGAFRAPATAPSATSSAFADLPPFCRVEVTSTPSPESAIGIEMWLPTSGWNGKLQGVGNGGWNGNIDRNALAAALRRGYAAASTDTGHHGGGGPWMASADKLVDFGYRAVHEMATVGKAVITARYGTAATRAYFTGCSGGGRQGLKAAQQFPDDFDGIVAGAPAVNATGRAAFSMWVAQRLRINEGSDIPAAKYPVIHAAVVRACDALDGVRDGVLENPRACRFDPKALQCSAQDEPTCLTAAQVDSVRTMYLPLLDPSSGRSISPGLEYGSEHGWGTFGGPQPFRTGLEMYQFMVFKDPSWNYRSLPPDAHMPLVDGIEKGVINALAPDLTPFIRRGGKLLHYHGWSDPQIPPGSSVLYHRSVLDAIGARDSVAAGYRMFMVPGMAHCGGGEGTATFDMLDALEAWVERGHAPDRVAASRVVNGRVVRTRPLCPYPQVASYRGSGSTDAAESFVCR